MSVLMSPSEHAVSLAATELIKEKKPNPSLTPAAACQLVDHQVSAVVNLHTIFAEVIFVRAFTSKMGHRVAVESHQDQSTCSKVLNAGSILHEAKVMIYSWTRN